MPEEGAEETSPTVESEQTSEEPNEPQAEESAENTGEESASEPESSPEESSQNETGVTENQEVESNPSADSTMTNKGGDELVKPITKSSDAVWSNPADAIVLLNREFFDFGKITDGETVKTVFSFTNAGTEPLEIETVSACFCISTDYSRDPVLSGQKANVEVVFDSNDQAGTVRKDIDVIFRNTDKDGYPLIKRLQLKGRVVAKK